MLPWITILRPLNLLQATLAVVLTTAFLGEMEQVHNLVLLVLSVITINAGGNIINDIYDLKIDRINRPDRPLPSGAMSVAQARIYLIFLFAAGILLSWFISVEAFIIAGPISIPTLIAYSACFKRQPLIGNLIVSFMLGLAFVYVGAAFGNIQATLVMAALAFGFTLIREIVKDLEDMEGDSRVEARTLPLVWGEAKTLNLVLLLMAAFVILDLLPYALGVYNQVYLWMVLLGINLPLLVFAFILWKQPDKKNYFRVQLFLKLDIFVGLAALYFGQTI
ncbi:MAG: geranylgeranylglycerol-phosphate geranylgeranyltransferase [Candidatus Marinimicrobia bacterium]|jgi:geranylgeranylglycerol-phosphate geranylgeranyltransferase|nr:geranylgeranylglycerol-phosphate geranylgeranyltransferase [Candidatus Neomarinimicrobiota bacterium]MBT3825681.1 geranylgeranylglycerol-phosphate geranylgeranyltransferase [Candidatus Neomarinimicrobiota bacterium]MBT4130575.1 geranylgeranylglycerol-phosphate geranylgeranyltransferase [Candidatus Neomarinimicrobiota bacterium]MBT4296204.1 geranylgeranylglycerol-phosphate geranylgeranyltransferase [Candidatus Neomarinimicrobiota bacterium]MBT4420999.1 geranylgeranylglycerol-phosphate geranyl